MVWEVGPWGGVRAAFEIAEELAIRGHDVRMITLGGDHRWSEHTVPVDVIELRHGPSRLGRLALGLYGRFWLRSKDPLSHLNADGFAQAFGFHADQVRALAGAIGDCDACVATWYPTALAVWIAGKGRPFYFMQDYPEQLEGLQDDYYPSLFKRTLELPFYFLTNSRYTEELVLERQRGAKVRNVGGGVDAGIFHPSRKIGDPAAKKVMVILKGAPFKGADVAIRTLNEVNESVRIHALVLGDPEPLKEIKPEFPYTYFRAVDDSALAELYSSADVFLFTSYAEGFGLPPLEAMACGTAVVTTDCKGNRDYAVDGRNCLMAPSGDHAALARAVVSVLNDEALRLRLSAEGERTAKEWTWKRTVDLFEDALINELQQMP